MKTGIKRISALLFALVFLFLSAGATEAAKADEAELPMTVGMRRALVREVKKRLQELGYIPEKNRSSERFGQCVRDQ